MLLALRKYTGEFSFHANFYKICIIKISPTFYEQHKDLMFSRCHNFKTLVFASLARSETL